MQDFKKLRAWQGARALTSEIHRVFANRRMPSYGWLKTQALRAAGSIPANVIQAFDLHFINEREFNELNERIDHVRRMLIRLEQVVRLHPPRQSTK